MISAARDSIGGGGVFERPFKDEAIRQFRRRPGGVFDFEKP